MNQLELISTPANTWETSDDWETPDDIAQRIAAMGRGDDGFVIEPSAGTGQIAQYLPLGSWCIESNSCRASIGAERCPDKEWMLEDFLSTTRRDMMPDLVIGNPPFSLWTEFLIHALELGAGRVVFLGPCDQFHKPTVWRRLGPWADRIQVTPHPIVGRVAYLRDGVPVHGRQVYDSIFEVKL